MVRVLHMPEHMQYQQRFLKSELVEIFRNAPPIVRVAAVDKEDNPNRKPIGDDTECAICYEIFDGHQETVYCKAACGNNLHQECMDTWIKTNGANATCPYCRAHWEDSGLEGKAGDVNLQTATVGEDGYVNVASQLGISGARDYSTYHQPWVSQRYGGGGWGRRGFHTQEELTRSESAGEQRIQEVHVPEATDSCCR